MVLSLLTVGTLLLLLGGQKVVGTLNRPADPVLEAEKVTIPSIGESRNINVGCYYYPCK